MNFKDVNIKGFIDGFKKGQGILDSFGKGITGFIGTFSTLTKTIMGVGAVIAVITLIAKANDKVIVTAEEAREKMDETRSSYDDTKSNVESLNSELETTRDRMNELMSKEHLSLVEQEELENLRKTNSELERRIALEEARAKVEARKLAKDAKETYEKWTNPEKYSEDPIAGTAYDEGIVNSYVEDLSKAVANNVETVIHNANAKGLGKKGRSQIEDMGFETKKDSINELIGAYIVLENQVDATNSKLGEYASKSNLTDEEQKEVDALDEYLEALKLTRDEARIYMDEYYAVMNDIYNNIKTAVDEGVHDADDPVLSSLENFMSSYGRKYFDASEIESQINGIFAKVEFSGIKEKLVKAGKEGQDVLENEITPELKSALEKAGVDLNKFIDHIMNLAQPNKRNIDHIKEMLKANYTPEGFKGGTWAMFAKDKTDDELTKFYDYVQQTNVDMSTWGLDDLKNYFNEAMAFYDEVASVDTEPISFSSLFKTDEKAPENFSEYVDKYTGELDNIKSALDNIESGEFDITTGTKDLIDTIPELAGHTDSLEEVQSTLNQLSYDKLQEFVQGYSKWISTLTTESERAAANDYLEEIVNSYNLENIHISENEFLRNIAKGSGIGRESYEVARQVYDEFGGTIQGDEILATLSLYPDAATWKYEQWKEHIEEQEVLINIRIAEESIAELERSVQETQNSISRREAEGERAVANGQVLDEEYYDDMIADTWSLINDNKGIIAKKMFQLSLIPDTKFFAETRAALEKEIADLEIENINLGSEYDQYERDKANIPLNELKAAEEELKRQISAKEAEIDDKNTRGIKVAADDYRELIGLQGELEANYNDQAEFYDGLMSDETIDRTSDYFSEISEGYASAANGALEASQAQQEYNNAITQNTVDSFRNTTMKNTEKQLEDAEKLIETKESRNEEVTEDDYNSVIDLIGRRISNLVSDNVLLEATATANGWQEGTDEWQENQDAIESNNDLIEELTQKQYEYNQALNELPIAKYQNQLEALQSQADLLQSNMDLNTANNKLTTEQDYKNLIANAENQKSLINSIIAEKAKLRDSYDVGSYGYNLYQNEINSFQAELNTLEQSIIEWSNTAKNLIVTNAQTLSSAISTAISEASEATGLTSESIATLKTQFSELTDMDTSDLFYNTADGIKISTKALDRFAREQNKVINNKFDKKINAWEKAIDNYQEEIGKGNVDDKLRGMQNELNDVMQQQAQYFATYQEQMDQISKFAKIEIAEGTPNQGAKYDSMQSRLESWKEMYDEGLIGTDDFKSISEYFNVDGLGFAENFQNDYKLAERYLKEDINGVYNFYDDLVAKGLASFDETTQSYMLMFDDVADAARTMGMGDEWFLDMLGKAEEYGAINTIVSSTADAALQTQELNQELFEAQQKLIELENAGASAESIAQQEAYIASLKSQAADIVDVESAYIDSLSERYVEGFDNIKDTLDKYNQYRQEALERKDYDHADQWQKLAEDLAKEYNIELEVSDKGMKLNESDYQKMYSEIYGNMGSWDKPITPEGIGVGSELASYSPVLNNLTTAYENNREAIQGDIDVLKEFSAEQLRSINLTDGQYTPGLENAEKALDSLATTLGITDPAQLQMLAYALEAVGNVKPEISPGFGLDDPDIQQGIADLKQMQEMGDISASVNLEADTSDMDLDELTNRLSGLENIKAKINTDVDSDALDAINALIQDTETQIKVRTVLDGGEYTIDELLAMDNSELQTVIDCDASEVDSVRQSLEEIAAGETVPITVKIDESQFSELTSTEKTVTMDSSSIDEAQNKLDTLNDTEVKSKKVDVNSKSADETQNKLDEINSTNIRDKSFTLSSNSQDVLRSLSSVLTYMNLLDGKTSTLTINKVTKETKVSEATGTLAHGTLIPAHASGTAYNMLNLKPAFARGTDVGIDHDQEALVNELGMQKCRYKIYLIAGKP